MRADAEAFPLFLITLCICSLLKSLPIISSWPKENLIRGWGWNVFTRWSYATDSLGASLEDFTWKRFLTPVLWNGFVYANLMSQGIKFNVWTGCGVNTFPKGDWCFPCWVPYNKLLTLNYRKSKPGMRHTQGAVQNSQTTPDFLKIFCSQAARVSRSWVTEFLDFTVWFYF